MLRSESVDCLLIHVRNPINATVPVYSREGKKSGQKKWKHRLFKNA